MEIMKTDSLRMSSREIANLLEKQHGNIKVSAQRLAERGVIALQETPYVDQQNMQTYTEYMLNKRDSLILVAQNSPEFTARIIDRWQELEAQLAAPAFDPANLSRLQLIQLALDAETELQESKVQVLALTNEIKTLAPKVEALDTIARSEGSLCMSDAAKVLQSSPKKFIDFLAVMKWIFKRTKSDEWIAYQPIIDRGYLEHKVVTWEARGTTRSRQQVMITPKGLTELAEKHGQFIKLLG